MGVVHREKGYIQVVYYIPRRLQSLWKAAVEKGYTPRDLFVTGLLMARYGGLPRMVRLYTPDRQFTVRLPEGAIRVIRPPEVTIRVMEAQYAEEDAEEATGFAGAAR
ncbi:hypothetical protein [Chloroflexus sp.]|uniref:hypothetical protein n=1 Tax=Chloroflexus sp. TaxID=1904827 RepID=UPI002ACE1D57|nr:hypothetical protein [Chloroflexus sp.]